MHDPKPIKGLGAFTVISGRRELHGNAREHRIAAQRVALAHWQQGVQVGAGLLRLQAQPFALVTKAMWKADDARPHAVAHLDRRMNTAAWATA